MYVPEQFKLNRGAQGILSPNQEAVKPAG